MPILLPYPLIKKPNLDREVLKNYRPVANLKFIAKIVRPHVTRENAKSCTKLTTLSKVAKRFTNLHKVAKSCKKLQNLLTKLLKVA